MTSSSTPAAVWLRPRAPPAGGASSFPTVSICGLLSLCGVSRVSTVSVRRRPASPLIRCSQDNGKIEVFNTEGTEPSQGGPNGSINYGKDSAGSFSSKEYSQLTIASKTKEMGYAAAVERFLKLMAMVWAGSQVTKILRVGGALALAPFVDRGLRWFTVRFNFKSEGKAFATIVGFCFALAALLFFGLTILWA